MAGWEVDHFMTARLTGKRALVTGAGQGIGRAIALAFAAEGAAVVAASRTLAKMQDLPGRAPSIRPVALDVTDGASCRAAVAAAVERFGGLDVLLYGAADNDRTATVLELDEAAWDRVIRINLTGAFLIARAAIPAMIARGGGSVILIASQLGRVALPGRAAYCATKGALVQLAKGMALDHAGDNIRVNTLSPGGTATERMVRRFGDLETAERVWGPKHPMGRLGRPEEIARGAVFLACDADSSFMTGADLLVDGGYTAW